jgi:hypothetical protein
MQIYGNAVTDQREIVFRDNRNYEKRISKRIIAPPLEVLGEGGAALS